MVLNALKRLDRGLATLEVALVTTILLAMVGMYAAHVVLRNMGEGGVPVFQTVVQHLVLWLAMLGATLAARARRHIAIEALEKALSPTGREVAQGIACASTALACAFLTWIAFTYVAFERGQYLAAAAPEPLFRAFGVAVPRWWSLGILPVGFALLTWRFGLGLLERLFGEARPPRGFDAEVEVEALALAVAPDSEAREGAGACGPRSADGGPQAAGMAAPRGGALA